MTKTATYIKTLDGFKGEARLYAVAPPIEERNWDDEVEATHDYVIVSGVYAMFSGPETYIFPADAEGNITSWLQLDGSFQGEIDHEQALSNAGYTVL